MVLTVATAAAILTAAGAATAAAAASHQEGLGSAELLAHMRSQKWVQIPGVEPILRPTMKGGGGSYIEMGDIIRDFDTYYLYFHGLGIGGHPSYSIGVASAPSPLGPWQMYQGNPIVYQTEDWEGSDVAMGSVLKRGVSGDTVVPPLPLWASSAQPAADPPASHCPPDCGPPAGPKIAPDPVTNSTYFMWYCTGSQSATFKGQAWSGGDNTGLATAPHPLGPWTKFEYRDGHVGGPVMNLTGGADFPGNREGIYNSQVVELSNGTLLMYGETMAGPGAADQRLFQEYLGGVGCWSAYRPEGPFRWVGFGPEPGGFGSWNDGGTSGGSVRMMGSGVWEMWFSGAKMRKNSRILPREEDAGVGPWAGW